MKKLLFLSSALLVLAASCEVVELAPDTESIGSKVEFLADGVETKTSFTTPEGGSYPVIWTSDDKSVAISLNMAVPVEAAVTPSADGKTATFSASFSASSESYTFSSVSPASESAGISDGAWTVTVPARQQPSATSVDSRAQLMAAVSESSATIPSKVSLKYKHLTSYLKLSLSNLNLEGESLSSVTVMAKDTPLAGKMHWYPVASGERQAGETVVPSTGASYSVTVSATGANDIWIATLPADLSGKELTIVAKGGVTTARRTVTLPQDRNLTSGKVASLTVDMSSAEVKKGISILAIGNSFSVDGMQYLPYLLSELGYEEIYLGNLYIGGCSLETHASNIESGASSYIYYTSEGGSWTAHNNSSIMEGITDCDWDYISLQQVSQGSGKPETYEPYLSNIVKTLRAKCPGSRLIWHITWPYQQSSNYSQFANYNYDQALMYSSIINAVKTKVLNRGDFELVIPAGTAIQNVRKSYIGDNTSRDGFHLNYGIGRLAAAMTWAKAITGLSVDALAWMPDSKYLVTERDLAAIKDAVNKAVQKPYEVSEAADTDLRYTPNSELAAKITAAGYNIENYDELPYSIMEYAFYNSSSNAIASSVSNGYTAANVSNFACSRVFYTKNQIPNGSLIVVANGWQYRPEGWTELKDKTTSRPTNVTTSIVKVDASWWGSFKYRAFNLSKTANNAITASEMASVRSNFAIFVPKPGIVEEDPTTDEIMESAGYKPSDYVKMPLSLTYDAFYNSTSGSALDTKPNAINKKFVATQIFDQGIIPDGAVIVVRKGFQYRPEAWTDLETKTTSSARPGNVSTSLVVVDAAWKGDWGYRAFNIANTSNTALSDEEKAKIASGAFNIYIPKSHLASLTTPEAMLAAMGFDETRFEKVNLTITHNAYYNSTDGSHICDLFTSSSNSRQFAATGILDKSEIPNGSVIVQLNGYQYRPEGWKTLTTANTSATRPANVTDYAVVVNDTWWGEWNYRAFNLAKLGNPTLTEEEQKKLDAEFAIFRLK